MIPQLLMLAAFLACGNADPHTTNSSSNKKIWNGNYKWDCGSEIGGIILCKEDSIEMVRCNCMFYDNITDKTVFGTCPYTCFNPQRTSYFKVTRYSVSNFTVFNTRMCNYYVENTVIQSHRTGRFCGQCESGHGLAVYSYHLSSCIPCTYSPMNWIKYICIALLPLTGFYCLVAMFGINLAAGKMNGLIFSLQIVMAPLNLILMDAWVHAKTLRVPGFFQLGIALFGPVNLDFFRDIYPKFCISPQFKVLHVLALDYLVALYPFLLIILTSILISMYDKGYVLVVWAWKPFKCMLRGRQLHKHTTLVETFCTFILLSSIKILGVSMSFLTGARIYDESGNKLRKNYLYLDASIKFFSSEHLYFGILAVLVSFIFVALPFLLLILYPCKCFQKLLNIFGGRFQALHVFMDAFQGNYRTHPVDLRYFSAYYFLIRFLHQFVVAYFQSVSTIAVTTVLLMITSIIFAIIKPYKSDFQNKIDLLSLLSLTLLYASATLMFSTFYLDNSKIKIADAAFLLSLLCIMLSYICMLSHAMFGQKVKQMFKRICLKKNNVIDEHCDINQSTESRSLLIVSN